MAEHRYIVNALAQVDVVVFADTLEDALAVGTEELWAGNYDSLYVDRRSVEVSLFEWEDET